MAFLAGIFFLVNPDVRGQQRAAAILSKSSEPNHDYINIKQKLDVALAKENYAEAAAYYEQLAEILYTEGAIVQALKYFLKAYDVFKKEGSLTNLARTQNRIGTIYFKNQRYDLALSNFKQSLSVFQKIKDPKGIAESYSSIGHVYQRQGVKDSSKYFMRLALSELNKIKVNGSKGAIYEKIGSTYEDLGDFDNALKSFLAAQQAHLQHNNAISAGLLNNIGDVYRKKGMFSEALNYSKKAEQCAAILKDTRQLSSAHRDLAKTFAMLGKYDSAYLYSEQARESYAKTFNQENNEQLYLLQTIFDIQQKDNEIAGLENERNLNRILSIAMTIIGFLIVFLGFAFISRQRLKIQNERELHQTQQKSLQLDLHNKQLLQEGLKDELELKSKELTSHTLHIIQKNQFLEELKNRITSLVKDDKRDQRKELKQLISLINSNSNQDKNWEDFKLIFENVHRNFFEKLNQHSPALTATDLRFLALLKMNLSSGDIATMLGVSTDSLRTTRYRIRKKLQLPEEGSLHNFVQGL